MAKPMYLSKEHSNLVFSPAHAPALVVDSGAIVCFETGDEAYERLASGESVQAIGQGNFNAVTGPVFVRGAEPGSALRIEILDVSITRAWAPWFPDCGGFKSEVVRIRDLPMEDEEILIGDRLRVPLRPMIGCIGLAPRQGESSTYEPAFPWGGNLDLPELAPGAEICLPVQVEGGLLYVGDLHAAQGEGEPAFVGLEAAGETTLRLTVEKELDLSMPCIRSGIETIFVGLGKTRAEATQTALDQAFLWLRERHGLETFDAYAYAAARVSLRFGGPACPMTLAVVPDPV
ncbi:MAG: acetamidase/formamidase family protein [Planctomycetota bacterium]|jgi:amidase